MKKNLFWFLAASILLPACDLSDDEVEREKPVDYGTKAIYMLCEGLMNQNNSTLASYEFTSKTFADDAFASVNKRGLGDTANEAIVHGGKIYVAVTGSSQVEILDKYSTQSLKQIPFFNDTKARQPRRLVGHKNKVYVCAFDGSVTRIDTTTLVAEALVSAGNVADGICVSGNELFVSLCGDWSVGYDSRVSVIDLTSFEQTRFIEVGINPTQIKTDASGDVYLISNGDYYQTAPSFQRIDAGTHTVTHTFDLPSSGFTISGELAYMIHYDYITKKSAIRVFDVKQEKLLSENFITDDTVIETPYGIQVNPANGDVYVTDVHHYVTQGDLVCFSPEGEKRFVLEQVGNNPNTTLFVSKK